MSYLRQWWWLLIKVALAASFIWVSIVEEHLWLSVLFVIVVIRLPAPAACFSVPEVISYLRQWWWWLLIKIALAASFLWSGIVETSLLLSMLCAVFVMRLPAPTACFPLPRMMSYLRQWWWWQLIMAALAASLIWSGGMDKTLWLTMPLAFLIMGIPAPEGAGKRLKRWWRHDTPKGDAFD